MDKDPQNSRKFEPRKNYRLYSMFMKYPVFLYGLN